MTHGVSRIAVFSLHSSPLDQPGVGDAGGMNVEVRAVAERLSELGVAVDVFTRCAGRGVPEVEPLGPLSRVIQIPAGPCEAVGRDALPSLVPAFADRVLDLGPYDLIHAHYWLSAAAGEIAAQAWRVPLVVSFHTLAEVKNLALSDDATPEPLARIAGEHAAVRAADRLVVPSAADAAHLIELYGADPERVAVVPPGVDRSHFSPGDRASARRALGLPPERLVLFVGRLQPHKGADVAVRAFARAVASGVAARLAVVGGASGPEGAGFARRLRAVAAEDGVAERVEFLAPRPHADLVDVYRAADVLLLPSRSESFGLAALEAQACGVPAVASASGGLRSVVRDGESGHLVPVGNVEGYAAALVSVLGDEGHRARLSRGALRQAARFPWRATVDATLAVYRDVASLGAAAAS